MNRELKEELKQLLILIPQTNNTLNDLRKRLDVKKAELRLLKLQTDYRKPEPGAAVQDIDAEELEIEDLQNQIEVLEGFIRTNRTGLMDMIKRVNEISISLKPIARAPSVQEHPSFLSRVGDTLKETAWKLLNPSNPAAGLHGYLDGYRTKRKSKDRNTRKSKPHNTRKSKLRN